MSLILKVRRMELREIYLPNTTGLVIVGGGILTHVFSTLIIGLLVAVQLFLCTMALSACADLAVSE